MGKQMTIQEYLAENDFDLESEELKEELSDTFKTGKNFLKIYRLLRNDVDLSEYEKVFNELRSLEYDTDRPLIIGKEKAIRCFNNYVDGEPLVYRLVRESVSGLPKKSKTQEKIDKLLKLTENEEEEK